MEQDINVMANVRKLAVSYKLPFDYDVADPALDTAFEFATVGARHSGFQIQWLAHRVPDQAPAVELRCLLILDKPLIADAGERLFWANDIALMTRSVMKCRAQFEIDRASASEPMVA